MVLLTCDRGSTCYRHWENGRGFITVPPSGLVLVAVSVAGSRTRHEGALFMRKLLVLLGTLSIFITACGLTSASSGVQTLVPTPDVPRFADGEAIAVVKTWLNSVIMSSGIPCTSYYTGREYQWQSRYMGNGIWSVSATKGKSPSSAWKVYERTLSVDQVKAAFRIC